jgi:DNA-binding winged helix-turn-helix (wHTH) protein
VIYRFEAYALDADRYELRREADLVAVEPQVLGVLLHLVRNRGRLVSRDDLIAGVWDGRFISESTLSSRVSAVRRAIGDNGEQQRLIRTLPRKGYRFIGLVQQSNEAGPHRGSVDRFVDYGLLVGESFRWELEKYVQFARPSHRECGGRARFEARTSGN